MQYILVSRSSLRAQLLHDFGLHNLEVYDCHDYESIDRELPCHLAAQEKVKKRVQNLLPEFKKFMTGDYCIIAMQTIIALFGEIYLKPLSYSEVVETLKKFSDRTHTVITAVYIYVCENGEVRDLVDYDYTHVTFSRILDADINAYTFIQGYAEKVGGYSVFQDPMNFVKEVKGSITNTYGVPFEKLEKMFKKLNLKKDEAQSLENIEKKLKSL